MATATSHRARCRHRVRTRRAAAARATGLPVIDVAPGSPPALLVTVAPSFEHLPFVLVDVVFEVEVEPRNRLQLGDGAEDHVPRALAGHAEHLADLPERVLALVCHVEGAGLRE